MTTINASSKTHGQTLVSELRKAGVTAFLLCFPDGRYIVRFTNGAK